MKIEDLPLGSNPPALMFPHFPTRLQAVIWRNWGMVPVEKLAETLQGTTAQITELAAGMGLKTNDSRCDQWQQRGYISIIRRNWHLLPYGQLLQLLGWTPKKLAFVLKEDDFLWHKLGDLKPAVEPVIYAPLSPREKAATDIMRHTLERYFTNEKEAKEQPFDFLEKLNRKREQPIENSNFGMKLAYSYCAVYGDPLLEPELDPYPDALLEEYAACGINAVWLQGTLYTLTPWAGESKYTEDWQQRLANLRELARKTAKHGIKLYLYMNEPRNMPDDFFEQHPDWRGAESVNGDFALCTSNPEVLNALRDGLTALFKAVPELGGVFTITMSENLTHCRSRSDLKTPCPACAKRPPEEFPAEVNQAIAEGVHRAKPDADVIAWTWAWAPEWDERAVELLPDDVKLMCVSETAIETDAMGIKGQVLDYSLSKVGPGPIAVKLWRKAIERGLGTVAKVQINNTWECSAVPYIPVPDLVERHLANLKATGVSDLMISWTLGGCPGGNLPLTGCSREELAETQFGSDAAPKILAAWSKFSSALENFPLNDIDQLYYAPQNSGPANLLLATSSGYEATMVGFPYDDLDTWRGKYYPEDIFEEQFRKLSEGWAEGLQILTDCKSVIPDDKTAAFKELMNISEAVYCHFRSAYLQIYFVRRRNNANINDIIAILDEEIELADRLLKVMKLDSRIGFEASNHYYYTVNDLKEKILNCEFLKQQIQN